jgi:hypothetical protein
VGVTETTVTTESDIKRVSVTMCMTRSYDDDDEDDTSADHHAVSKTAERF